ncbi:MAG: DUF423 domain-containing protein [Flavobacteriaceae bacterium]|nr:DUF423 domain-containing protein [Flavobacteriaceae bacterium]
MSRQVVFIGALLGALGVCLGAYGAHGLKSIVSEVQVSTFEVGVRYQMYHAFFLLFVGMCGFFTDKIKKVITILVVLGILFFSGSIYLLTLKDLISMDLRFVGPITPIGGLLLIIAWLTAAIQALKHRKEIK